VRPVAAEMVAKKGEFHPLGASLDAGLDASGKLGSVAIPAADHDHPKSAQLIAALKSSFRGAATTHEIVASALVYDLRVTPPGRQEKTDAIAIDLDHRRRRFPHDDLPLPDRRRPPARLRRTPPAGRQSRHLFGSAPLAGSVPTCLERAVACP
jgi:hypothetical protein